MQFVTAFLAVLDPATGDISYSSAGHPPAIACHERGGTDILCISNIPLGIQGGAKYDEKHYTLRHGDSLVLYTDGITEARHDHVLFGTEGLEDILSTYSSAAPDELVEEILSAVRDWAHGKLRDDTAVLIIRREM
jgi:serine phosphatase RsbU (regulator of sigma subunit)